MGAYVALFEHSDFNPPLVGNLSRHAVNGPAVTKHENDINITLLQDLPQELRPFIRSSAEGNRISRIEQGVAAVKIDLADLGPGPAQIVGEAAKKRTNRRL